MVLKDCLEIFRKEYDKYGDSLILENYKLVEGSYILVKKNGEVETLEVKKDGIKGSDELYTYIAERDYLSKYLNSNKAINTTAVLAGSTGKKIGTKVVYSNNYLTFFIKKETLHLNKINRDVICKYYETIDSVYGIEDQEYLGKIQQWMLENFMDLDYPESEGKEYLKIFFEEDIETYRTASDKYLLSKVYNSNQYNIDINGVTYGLPDNNMGLNSNKPYLENKTRKNPIPYLISEEEVLIQKKFFDYLATQLEQGKRFIYIDTQINAYKAGERPQGNFNGSYLRIAKGLEPEIRDMEVLVNFSTKIPKFVVETQITTNDENNHYINLIDYSETEDIRDIETSINEVFFNKFLKTSYFLDFKDIKLSDTRLKKILYDNRNSLFAWFYKGDNSALRKSFPKFSLDIIKNTLMNNPSATEKAVEQYNLRYSVCKYLNGGIRMSANLNDIRAVLRAKMNNLSGDDKSIQTDEEYYYAIGQLAKYFMSLSKTGNKTYFSINSLLNNHSNLRILKELEKMFKKYNYAINFNNKRFENLYSMILEYKTKSKVNTDMLIAGYISENLMYEKTDEMRSLVADWHANLQTTSGENTFASDKAIKRTIKNKIKNNEM